MNINPKIEPWLRKLLDGVENSNNAAEVVATAAYDAMRADEVAADGADTRATLQAEFRKCLCEISFTRAGYDVRQMPPAQKSSEAATSSDYMTQARQLWAENPDKHASLRGVFKDVNPLVEMREIERVPEHHQGKMP